MKKETLLLFTSALFLKFLIFDVIWAIPTTFTSFSTVEFWVTKLIAALLLAAPVCLFRLWKTEVVVMLLLDALLVANLMYFRTYYSAIPLSSYALSGNLADFTGSVWDSLRWCDLLFPLSTIVTALLYRLRVSPYSDRAGKTEGGYSRQLPRWQRPGVCYWGTLTAAIAVLCLMNSVKGGFRNAYDRVRQGAYTSSAGSTIYTLFGSLYYDLISSDETLTPEARQEIEQHLEAIPEHLPIDSLPPSATRNSLVLILAESLESWVLEREVEGQEITPCLNRLLREESTLYAPNVLTQVKGGRSIDAQLLVLAGLLPVNSGTYSSQYPDHTYLTLQKAMHEQKGSRNYLLTIDKLSTWNQGVIAQRFGTDTILAYQDFELTEAFGTHKRVGDGAFFDQCRQKMERGEIWQPGEHALLQFVTYSGHAPWKMPDELKRLSFPPEIPTLMADYMTVANYTDRAIGRFIDYLKSRPDYDETLIVITGDHEGLASQRETLLKEKAAQGIVSSKPFTPFIVVNAPVGLRYEQVLGQIDLYPTLLNLLQLDSYRWTGLGTSLFHPGRKDVAVGSQLNTEGSEAHDSAEVERLKKAYDISDQIIRLDYLKQGTF
ncbi:MAG: LTA synthase family protein [Bacteroides sp.]|nr:LTA synthase family protein [Bacteroides sp.]